MQPRILSFTAFASALLLYGISSSASAEELSTMENDNGAAIHATEQAASPEALPWHTTENSLEATSPESLEPQEDSFADARLSDNALDAYRGAQGGDTVVYNSQNGLISNNNVSGDQISGNNTISDGSFAGAALIGNVGQNTGNNSIMQLTTTVNVYLDKSTPATQ